MAETQIDPHELLTVAQVSEITGLIEPTLAKMRHMKTGPDYLKLGHRTIRYQRAAVAAWIERCTVHTSGAA